MMLRIWDTRGIIDRSFISTLTHTSSRNYVTQDVLRRIMTDFFGYDVHFVMNVTDIDDKVRHIIKIFP